MKQTTLLVLLSFITLNFFPQERINEKQAEITAQSFSLQNVFTEWVRKDGVWNDYSVIDCNVQIIETKYKENKSIFLVVDRVYWTSSLKYPYVSRPFNEMLLYPLSTDQYLEIVSLEKDSSVFIELATPLQTHTLKDVPKLIYKWHNGLYTTKDSKKYPTTFQNYTDNQGNFKGRVSPFIFKTWNSSYMYKKSENIRFSDHYIEFPGNFNQLRLINYE